MLSQHIYLRGEFQCQHLRVTLTQSSRHAFCSFQLSHDKTESLWRWRVSVGWLPLFLITYSSLCHKSKHSRETQQLLPFRNLCNVCVSFTRQWTCMLLHRELFKVSFNKLELLIGHNTMFYRESRMVRGDVLGLCWGLFHVGAHISICTVYVKAYRGSHLDLLAARQLPGF